MRVVLWRKRRESEAAGAGYQQYLFNLRRLGIGSGVDQPVCVRDPRLAHRHAVIERRWGQVRIRAWTSVPVVVNGTPRRRARLRAGDRIELGPAILAVRAIRGDGVVVLRLKETGSADSAAWHRVAPLTIEQTGLRRSRLVRRTVAVMTVLVVALPLLASLDTPLRDSLRAAPGVPSDASWQPGPLQHAHEVIGRDCNSCHRQGFHRVPNAACVTCHGNTQHHVGTAPAARQLFARKRCAECHVEHATPSRLIDRDSALCTSCHASLRRQLPGTGLQDASDFGDRHPEFALAFWVPPQAGSRGDWREQVLTMPPAARPNEQSHLKFSHAVHLRPAGVKSPTGERLLACHDCHRSDTDRRYMEPIRMESHCIECHELRFDEHDPGSQVPHGDTDKVLDALQSHFSRRFLELQVSGQAARRRPGQQAGTINEADRRQALAWATRETRQAATELIERRVCVQCHEITVTPGAAGSARWHIEPIAFVARWMPRASFDHTRHADIDCTGCHHGARESKSAHDVLMPQLADCRRCHGGSNDTRRVASECVLCHQFHQPGRGSYAANVRETADARR